MLAKTRTCALVGLDGVVVESEVDIAPGLPAFHIVGLADTADSNTTNRTTTILITIANLDQCFYTNSANCTTNLPQNPIQLSPAMFQHSHPHVLI